MLRDDSQHLTSKEENDILILAVSIMCLTACYVHYKLSRLYTMSVSIYLEQVQILAKECVSLVKPKVSISASVCTIK